MKGLENKKVEEGIEFLEDFFKEEKDHPLVPIIYDIAELGRLRNWIQEILAKLDGSSVLFGEELAQLINDLKNELFRLVNTEEAKQDVDYLLEQKSTEEYFGKYFLRHNLPIEDYNTLVETEKVYFPKAHHTWRENLQWLWKHFENRSEFVVLSMICKPHRKRSSGRLGSGFYREISTCIFAKYSLLKNDGEIILEPPSKKILDFFTFIGPQSNSLEISEMAEFYLKACTDFGNHYPVKIKKYCHCPNTHFEDVEIKSPLEHEAKIRAEAD